MQDQYIVESFHDIMKLKIEEEKLNPKVDQPGKTRDFPNKDGPVFFYRLKNYRSTPIPRYMDLILPEDQWEQFDGDVREGVDHFYQSELTIEPKRFTNENDGFRWIDSWIQSQATIDGKANPKINITTIFANTPLHNTDLLDGFRRNGCRTQLQAATNENGLSNFQANDNNGYENNNEQAIDDRTRGNENKQGFRNETQHEQEAKLQNNGNTKPNGPKSFHTTSSKQELGNPNILQSQTSLPQLTHPQNQAKLNEKLLYPNKRYCQPQTITLKAKQACIVRTQQVLNQSI
ncbi:MAG: hypothetical protein EZS28_039065, partial [Streblomastix strix]